MRATCYPRGAANGDPRHGTGSTPIRASALGDSVRWELIRAEGWGVIYYDLPPVCQRNISSVWAASWAVWARVAFRCGAS